MQNETTMMEKALNYINEDKPCFRCEGFLWKGAKPYPITKEKALNLYNSGYYHFGKGYNELRFKDDGLYFFSFSDSDMM